MSSATEKAISIKCESATTASIHDLNDLQGNLKSLTESNFKALKQSLVKDGLPLALHSWRDENGKLWTVDGHMRIKALKSLEADGYFIPPIPITLVKASNKKEAAKAILISSSRYGVLEDSGLADFMIDFDLKLEDIELLDLPEISLDSLAQGSIPGGAIDLTSHSGDISHELKIKCESFDEYQTLTRYFDTSNTSISFKQFSAKVGIS